MGLSTRQYEDRMPSKPVLAAYALIGQLPLPLFTYDIYRLGKKSVEYFNKKAQTNPGALNPISSLHEIAGALAGEVRTETGGLRFSRARAITTGLAMDALTFSPLAILLLDDPSISKWIGGIGYTAVMRGGFYMMTRSMNKNLDERLAEIGAQQK